MGLHDRMHMVNLPRRKRTRTRTNSLDLPVDIITDILLRLPFDSLLNCKFVSTQWKNLINHPNFSKKYKGYTNSMSLFTDCKRILCLRIRYDKNKQLTKSLNPRFTVHKLPIACDKYESFNYTQLSNGIVCYFNCHGVFDFYNLMTGSPALHSVTNSPLPQPYSYRWKYYGFGYDAYADDYKIVQLCHFLPTRHEWTCEIIDTALYAPYADDTQFWVYSIKNHEWKSFNGFPYSAYAARYSDWASYTRATTVNGILHWLVPHKGVIITYDLHTGVFGEIVLPGVGVNEVGNGIDFCLDFTLEELNGKLCYTYKRRYTYHRKPLVDVWRMVGDSWEMLVSIDCAKVDGKIPWHMVQIPEILLMLHECADGRRLLLFKDRTFPTLHWYDFVNNKCETFRQKVWHQQRIKNRPGRRGKRKTSLVVKN